MQTTPTTLTLTAGPATQGIAWTVEDRDYDDPTVFVFAHFATAADARAAIEALGGSLAGSRLERGDSAVYALVSGAEGADTAYSELTALGYAVHDDYGFKYCPSPR